MVFRRRHVDILGHCSIYPFRGDSSHQVSSARGPNCSTCVETDVGSANPIRLAGVRNYSTHEENSASVCFDGALKDEGFEKIAALLLVVGGWLQFDLHPSTLLLAVVDLILTLRSFCCCSFDTNQRLINSSYH